MTTKEKERELDGLDVLLTGALVMAAGAVPARLVGNTHPRAAFWTVAISGVAGVCLMAAGLVHHLNARRKARILTAE